MAVIVDQLSLTVPDPAFVEDATSVLTEAGYAVDYVPGEEVTVDFYRRLPTHGYDLIILRVHSASVQGTWRGKYKDETILFTSEPFQPQRYLEDLLALTLASVQYHADGARYMGIGADFVEIEMEGSFEGTTVIMMGCEGLTSERTAQSFIQKGAEAYFSWDHKVSASHTDAATERLLKHLLIDRLPAGEAVADTMLEVGQDPVYHSNLLVYPAPE